MPTVGWCPLNAGQEPSDVGSEGASFDTLAEIVRAFSDAGKFGSAPTPKVTRQNAKAIQILRIQIPRVRRPSATPEIDRPTTLKQLKRGPCSKPTVRQVAT